MNTKAEYKEITNTNKLMSAINNSGTKSILLANGFNVSIGVNTQYQHLITLMREADFIKEIIDDNIFEIIKKNSYNLEESISEISESHYKTVLSEFYRTILDRCKKRISKHTELINFLKKFDMFFTTNYDPLLYHYLLALKPTNKYDLETGFAKDLREIHNGKIYFENRLFEALPLRAITKKHVYEFAKNAFAKKEIHKYEKRDDFYTILKLLREEPTISLNDGFVINQSIDSETESSIRYKTWKESSEQNLFYLHGTLHMFSDGSNVNKIINKKGYRYKTFINNILDIKIKKSSLCVFENKSADKLEKINNNKYLRKCLSSLEKNEHDLFIIGWSGNKNDQHLINAINESPAKNLYVSYYSDESKQHFSEILENKNIIFFKSSLLPFSKKERSY